MDTKEDIFLFNFQHSNHQDIFQHIIELFDQHINLGLKGIEQHIYVLRDLHIHQDIMDKYSHRVD